MLQRVIAGIFGNRHDRERKRVQPIVDAINEHYERLHGISEEELRGQTARFREVLRERTGEIESRWRRDQIEIPRDGKMSTRRDQRVDLGGSEMFQ